MIVYEVISDGSELDDICKCASCRQRLNLTSTVKRRRKQKSKSKYDAHSRILSLSLPRFNVKLKIAAVTKQRVHFVDFYWRALPHFDLFEDFRL